MTGFGYNVLGFGSATSSAAGPSIQYLVIAGGGSGGGRQAGGGGAGGYRSSVEGESTGGGGTLESAFEFTVGTEYTVTVGAGGSAATGFLDTNNGDRGDNGSNSAFGAITSIGGGAGGTDDANKRDGQVGGSGGGSMYKASGTVTAAGTSGQGYAGGVSDDDGGGTYPSYTGPGGGGASQVGQNSTHPYVVGDGGDGLASSITGSSVARGGGGAGGCWSYFGGSMVYGIGGTGGGASSATSHTRPDHATANTGGGGAGGSDTTGGSNSKLGSNGGSGVVILKVPTANYTGTTSGSPSVSTVGDFTILLFNSSGSYTA